MGILTRLFRRKPRASVRDEPVVVIFATAQDGVSVEDATQLREIFNAAQPIGWWFLNPGSFLAVVEANRAGRDKASAVAGRLGNLRMTVPTLSDLKIGVAEGPVLLSRDTSGALNSMPFGATVNKAIRAALEEVSPYAS
jgi:class 3 adenylate cyclase